MRNILVLLLLITCSSCDKWVDAGNPADIQVAGNIYSSDISAAKVLTGIYQYLSESGFATGEQSISYCAGLSADEFNLLDIQNNWIRSIYQNVMTADFVPFWSQLYATIYKSNVAIYNIRQSTSLSSPVQQQLTGEALFLRAFCYYYLSTFFGNVPLTTSIDFNYTADQPRSDTALIYQQLTDDLTEAIPLLSEDYLQADVISPSSDRVRPTKWAALALLARVSLTRKDYATATQAADQLINNPTFQLSSLQQVFNKNSTEAIWQLQPVNAHYTEDAQLFINTKPISLSDAFIHTFEPSDQRRRQWLLATTLSDGANYFPYKYKSTKDTNIFTEYLMVMRLAEIYLIRAEARLYLGDIDGAKDDLDIIRLRAGLPRTTANDVTTLTAAILHERQTELFSEWGHRWIDLKRSGNVDAVMPTACTVKGSTWQNTHQWYPIPKYDIMANPKIIQNEGY